MNKDINDLLKYTNPKLAFKEDKECIEKFLVGQNIDRLKDFFHLFEDKLLNKSKLHYQIDVFHIHSKVIPRAYIFKALVNDHILLKYNSVQYNINCDFKTFKVFFSKFEKMKAFL